MPGSGAGNPSTGTPMAMACSCPTSAKNGAGLGDELLVRGGEEGASGGRDLVQPRAERRH